MHGRGHTRITEKEGRTGIELNALFGKTDGIAIYYPLTEKRVYFAHKPVYICTSLQPNKSLYNIRMKISFQRI